MKNKIITSEGNVQFQFPDGKIINVHPFHIYTVFNEDTVSFLLIAMPKSSGLAIFTSKASDLEVDGTVYTIEQLPNALSEVFAKAGAVARYEIVDELPTSGQSNTIYLVPKSEGIGYDEYIYVNGEWELIGDTDIELDRYVDKETFSGYTADTLVLINTVSGNVITESERAISAETALQTAIDNEVSARTDADTALSGAVDSVISDLASEVSRAEGAEASLSSAIDTEIAAREAADSVISGAVDTLSTNLSNEVQRAISAETALDSKIEIVSGQVISESERAISAETDLQTAINEEASARTADVEALSGAVDNVQDEVDILSAALEEETSARTDADSALTEAINAVDSKVDTLSGEVETMGDEAIVDAEYISSSTTIDFYNAGGAVVAQVDASDFIVDGMVDDVRIENGYLVIDFNTASGKQDISIPLTDIFDPSNYYDKDDVDGLIADVEDRIAEDEEVTAAGLNALNDALSGKADSDDVYTKAEVDGKVALKADLTALNNEISARTDGDTALDSKIDGKVVELTQAQYDALVDKDPLVLYVITDAVEVNMNDYYKKVETSGATEIQTALDAKLNTSDFNTYSANTQTAINAKANSADVYTKSQVYTKAEVDEAIAEIDLSEIENRISEDEEVTAAGLNAVNDKFDGMKLKKISQTDYDNLQTKDSNTLYIITD